MTFLYKVLYFAVMGPNSVFIGNVKVGTLAQSVTTSNLKCCLVWNSHYDYLTSIEH